MTPLPYHEARRHHPQVADRDGSHSQAIWDVLVGIDPHPTPGSVGEAISDTMPEDLVALLASSPTVVAAAFAHLYDAWPWEGTALARRDAARGGWECFRNHAQHVADIAQGFGWDLSDAWAVDADVARIGSVPHVGEIAALAGRMYASLRGEVASRVSGIVGELYSVEQGDDLGRMLPVERLALTEPLLELALFDRLESRRMLQYSVRGDARAAKGPLVLCLDESGSMHDQRRIWSKAAALACARVARDERRQVAVVHYSTSRVVRELDPQSPASVLAMLRSFLDGGTRIGAALEAAFAECRDLPGADVVLVTDGVDGNVEAITSAIDGAGSARLWTVCIECQLAPEHPLRARAAAYAHVSDRDLSDPTSVHAMHPSCKERTPAS